MRLIYVLLSPTFGMHQYTADLANRAMEGAFTPGYLPDVHVVTTAGYPEAPYNPRLQVHTAVTFTGTGFSREGAAIQDLRRATATIKQLIAGQAGADDHTPEPTVVHITGVHLWNVALVRALVRQGTPVVHTLHDLEPHSGVRFGSLIPRWNSMVIRAGAHILVHGRRYQAQLLARGLPASKVTYSPLLHGFWRFGAGPMENSSPALYSSTLDRVADRCQNDLVLFFGRVEAYKGVDTLLAAWSRLADDFPSARLIIAGSWSPDLPLPSGQPNVDLRNRLIADDEALDLFNDASLLVLPYRDATQSALIAAGYAFGLPVLVTDSGALAEYVEPGHTGWVVAPDDPDELATALRDALSSRSRLHRIGANGRAWLEKQLVLETQTLTKMYHDLTIRPTSFPDRTIRDDK